MIISPYQFVGEFAFSGIEVRYVETRELGQGGPVLGNILINRNYVFDNNHKAEFGGPFLIHEERIYAPFLNRFKFVLSIISMKSREIVFKSAIEEDIILIKNIVDNAIFYYNDLANKNLKQHSIPKI